MLFVGQRPAPTGFSSTPRTNRDFIKKFVPEAARTINLDVQHSAELFYCQIMAEEARR